jgi:hypothetical protein
LILIRGRFAAYGEVWFDEPVPNAARVDVVMFRRRPRPVETRRCVPFLSLVNDLSVGREKIIAGFGSSNRWQIRRAESRDEFESDVFQDPRAEIDDFIRFYDEFALQKGLQRAYGRGLRAACDAGQLVLTRARCAQRTLVWHAYIKCQLRIVLIHSASHFRNLQHVDRRLPARANRWLHWRDMMHFQDCGLLEYDWGGLFEDESDSEHAGINNFKREFGGHAERTFDANVPITMRGKAYLAVRETLEHLTTR